MARILTFVVLGSIGWFGQRWSPVIESTPAAPDALGVTPLRVHMAADGSVGIWGWPKTAEAMSLEEAMQTAQESLSEETREQLSALRVFPIEGLFNGWLRVHVDPDVPFGQIWQLFSGLDRDDSVYKLAFDGSAHAPPVFVQMPVELDWVESEGEPAVWMIQGPARIGDSGALGTGVRHALGRYLGDSTMTVANYYISAEPGLAVIGADTPRLIVDPDVPWSEVEPVLSSLSKNGISWWPILTRHAGLMQVEERYADDRPGCVGL